MTRAIPTRLLGMALVLVAVAAVLVSAALADKPVKPNPTATVKLSGGKGLGTTLVLSTVTGDFASKLQAQGIAVKALMPAKGSGTAQAPFRFPITQGKVVTPALIGTIRHVGGLSFTKGTTVVRARNLVIAVTNSTTVVSAKLTAQVNGKRMDFATLTLPSDPSKVTVTATSVTITDIPVTLNAAIATALEKSFNLTAGTLGGATNVGTAAVKARIVG